jgi:hypothetical protein
MGERSPAKKFPPEGIWLRGTFVQSVPSQLNNEFDKSVSESRKAFSYVLDA